MYLGFNKNLGRGLRIHFNKRIGGKKQFTQAEIKEKEKDIFLNEISSIIDTCLGDFLQYCGYSNKTIEYMINAVSDTSIFFANAENDKLFNQAAALQSEVKTILEKVAFSNVLTAKRREELTDKVFEINSILEKVTVEQNAYERILQIIANSQSKSLEQIIKERDGIGKYGKIIKNKTLNMLKLAAYTIFAFFVLSLIIAFLSK